jgi:signal transduction histidine kinase
MSGTVTLTAGWVDRPAGRGTLQRDRVEVGLPLAGPAGLPVATVHYSTSYPVAREVARALHQTLAFALAGLVLSLALLAWGLAHWVGRPLAALSRAIGRDDPAGLTGMIRRDDEVGELSRVVARFFEQQARMEQARLRAEEANDAKSRFLASISHELRTPMHGILSYARFGLRDAATAGREELRENFRNIEECGSGLLILVNDLLDLSKFEAGRMRLTLEPADLAALADQAADEFASLFHERGLTLESEVAGHLPPVTADRMKLLQVLRNLFGNAARFTPRGGRVVLRLSADDRCARMVVEDDGPGVPHQDLQSIFDSFVQSGTAESRNGGTGLGLAICREIALAHDGRIWAENRPAGGARFVFEVPLAGPAAEVPPAPRAARSATTRHAGATERTPRRAA